MSEDAKKFSIIDFVKKYNSTTSEQIKKTMLNNISKEQSTYVPYQQKIEAAINIIEEANYVYNGKNKKYFFNSPVQYLNYVKTLLALYTNFQLNDSFYEEYDILNQYDLLKVIIQRMPVDKVEFDIVFNMVRDDAERNEYSSLLIYERSTNGDT